MRTAPELLKASGYHTCNLSFDEFMRAGGPVTIAKTDYNFVWNRSDTYDDQHWASRKKGQPFFVQVQLAGGKHRGQQPGAQWPQRVQKTLGSVTSPLHIHLPPYLPDDPVLRADWAQYLDCVRYTDWELGQIIQRLKDAGEWERTVVFFWSDHGVSHVRNKQFLYDGGIRVPLIVHGPGMARGGVRSDLVEHIDIAATTLALAGLPHPAWMQGRGHLNPIYEDNIALMRRWATERPMQP